MMLVASSTNQEICGQKKDFALAWYICMMGSWVSKMHFYCLVLFLLVLIVLIVASDKKYTFPVDDEEYDILSISPIACDYR